MAVTLSIDQTTCIRCGKCSKVCPSKILTQGNNKSIEPVRVETCILCGHCVAVCPTSSVQHNYFPAEKVHAIDRSQLPSPEQVLLLCRARRSNRAFSGCPVPQESLDMILEAAHRAPTASNRQQVAFTVVTDPEKLHAISRFTVDNFAAAMRLLTNPLLRPALRLIVPHLYDYLPSLQRLIGAFEQGEDLILRGATAVILIHMPADNPFGSADANLAYQNGSLMAESLGVSQFYTGFVCNAIRRDKKNKLAKILGIDGQIHAGMALGMPQFTFPNYIDKKPLEVNY